MDKVLFEGCFALYNKQCAKKSQARSLQEKILKRSLAFSGYLKQWRIQGCASRALPIYPFRRFLWESTIWGQFFNKKENWT